MDHIGYDLEGEKVARPKGEDAIDRFMALNETSSGWKSVYDEKTGKRVIISDRDMEIIKRLQQGTSSSRYDAENVRLGFNFLIFPFYNEFSLFPIHNDVHFPVVREPERIKRKKAHQYFASCGLRSRPNRNVRLELIVVHTSSYDKRGHSSDLGSNDPEEPFCAIEVGSSAYSKDSVRHSQRIH